MATVMVKMQIRNCTSHKMCTKSATREIQSISSTWWSITDTLTSKQVRWNSLKACVRDHLKKHLAMCSVYIAMNSLFHSTLRNLLLCLKMGWMEPATDARSCRREDLWGATLQHLILTCNHVNNGYLPLTYYHVPSSGSTPLIYCKTS